MAGLIERLFGGKSRATEEFPEPDLGIGGYDMPAGPSGETGFPGSTSATRTFQGSDQQAVKIPYSEPAGAQTGLTEAPVVRQVPPRFGNPRSPRNPRQTPRVAIPQDEIRYSLQHNSDAEWYGGQPLKNQAGYDLAGLNPLSGAEARGGHSVRDTETPATQRQPVIGVGTPGAENVRNQVAERYKNPPGQAHSYKSAPRGDQAPQEVTVPNRFVFPGDGNQTWSVLRQMPYTGRGDGARGAALNGQRYFATYAGENQFVNAGNGQYGKSRLEGPNHRPTQFQEPAPWSSNYVDTTSSVGTPDNPGSNEQAPDLTYVSPSSSRSALNRVRRGG